MPSLSHEALDISMMFAQCFILCYISIWLLELAVETYNIGIISRVPEAGFWTIIASAFGAGFCVIAWTLDRLFGRKENEGPPLY